MSFPRRFAQTQRFTLGAPRNFTVTPSGDAVVFARSSAGDDPVHSLWRLDLGRGQEELLCDPQSLAAPENGELTEAEKARRERAREAAGGIVNYTISPDGACVIFVLAGRIYRTDLRTRKTTEVPSSANAFDARQGASGTIVYVSGGDLRATGDDRGDRQLVAAASETESWGSAEFVAAEEMRRSRGWWWNDAGTSIVATQVFTNDVPEWWIASPVDPAAPPRTHRYPAAGTTNATVALWTIDVHTGAKTDLGVLCGPGHPHEYLAQVRWGKRARITVVTQSRDQRRLEVAEIDPGTLERNVVAAVTDANWIDLVPGVPAWAGDRLVTPTIHDDTITLAIDGKPLGRPGFQVREVIGVFDDHAMVLASDDPLDLQVARIGFDGSAPEVLSDGPGVHRAAADDKTVVIATQRLDEAPSFRVVDGPEIASLAEQPTVVPQPTIFAAGPLEIRTAVLLPQDHDGSALPVLMDPYGGPHAQRVVHARNAYLTSQWFADQGFAVIVADGRGTPGRGAAFERAVAGDLAAPVLDDQVAALEASAERFPLDLSRVAIRGWSFGGYLAALAVLRRPDVFHAAVAGAPVTDWELYDTHYTERYLGNPSEDATPYERTNLCREATQLTRPLLLIHGLADDNVVAAHTLALSRALLEAGRPHQVLPLSGVTHMTPQAEVAENLLLLQLRFITDALGLATPDV